MPFIGKDRGDTSSRRDLLLNTAALGTMFLAGGAFGALFVGRGAADDAPAAPMHAAHKRGVPTAPWDRNAPLVEPEVRRSAGGELSTSLRVGYAYKDLGGYRLSLRTYEGGVPGPTLRVRPGDVLRIRIDNQLPPNPDAMPRDMSLPHQFNSTNLHFHGGHVSPSGISDNVFRVMEPGRSHEVEIAIPADHTRGSYWYHPHKHGSADVQMTSGMAGMLIVEGDFDDIPEIRAAREQVLILNEVMFDHRGAIETYDTIWPEGVPRFLSVNGQREPVIRMRPGEVLRWRLLHTGHQDNLKVALDAHALHPVAFDGIRRREIDSRDALLMAPGQRADVLLQAGAPGAYMLRAIANDQGYPSPTGPLARVIVEGEPAAMSLPRTLGGTSPLRSIEAAEVTNRREITLKALVPENPRAAGYQEFTYLVCGQSFDPNRVDHAIPLGAVEEWKVVNEDRDEHVFHVHTNPFQMIAVNDTPLAEPEWHDTVVVPRNGSVTLRMRFLDFTGRFVLHCHMMNHEELGMMQVIEVQGA